MKMLDYNEALESIDLKLDEVYEKYGFDTYELNKVLKLVKV